MLSPDLEIVPYSLELKGLWDEFVDSSKNATFLLKRDYMDYHADRFEDSSYIIMRKGRPYCLFPACISDNTISSHAGLTYGGLIMGINAETAAILESFNQLVVKLKERKIKNLIYKAIPHIYHSIPSEEDLYALFRNQAKLKIRNVSSVVDLNNKIQFSTLRKRSLKKSRNYNVVVRQSMDFETFWKILENNLSQKYGIKPVHTIDEIKKLAYNFPLNIKLYAAYIDDIMTGGVVCYQTKTVMHAQYISSSPLGKQTGAIDSIFDYLINNFTTGIRYFDFGISNEKGGTYLNESLIHQKEGFGARAICYDTYEIIL